MKDRICVFTSAHRENDIRIFKKEIKCLLDNGMEVIYFTNKENLNVKKEYLKNYEPYVNPDLEVYYNKNFYVDRRMRRFLKSFFFFLYLPKDCRIYHFHDPDLLFTGLVLKILGKKVIYDVHENYRDSIRDKEYLPEVLKITVSKLVSFFETFCCRFFDMIICATPYIEKRFSDSGIVKTCVVSNYPLKSEFSSNPDFNAPKENRIIYAGGITKKRGISKLIQSLTLIDQNIQFKLILAGEINPPEYEHDIRSLDGWKNVEYLGILSRIALAEQFNKAIGGIALFLPEKNHIYSQPNKIFEYMSAGIPVICSNFPLWREIVEANQCGICVDPDNIEEIAEGIKFILLNGNKARVMGKNGERIVKEMYNWETEESKLVTVYKGLLSGNKL